MTSATGFVENFPCLHRESQGRTRRFRASQIAPFGDLYCKRGRDCDIAKQVEHGRFSTSVARKTRKGLQPSQGTAGRRL